MYLSCIHICSAVNIHFLSLFCKIIKKGEQMSAFFMNICENFKKPNKCPSFK